MGNVPAKESGSRSRSSSYLGNYLAYSGNLGSGLRRNLTNTLSAALLGSQLSERQLRRTEEKDRARRQQALDLIVRATETVDGGYLAPHGTYKLNLDYSTPIVRTLILRRKLAPFYTPLQDFDGSWSDAELVVLVRQLPLHQVEPAYLGSDEPDDADNHKLHKLGNYYRRQETKAKIKQLELAMKEVQKGEEQRYIDLKALPENSDLSSDALILRLYKDAAECPICFLYYPRNLNVLRCCAQPICSECFVQIKRLDPHPPHEEHGTSAGTGGAGHADNESNDVAISASLEAQEAQNAISHTLISKSANCPYCGMEDFGVTYDAPLDVHTGIDGQKPGLWPRTPDTLRTSPKARTRRKLLVAADAPGVVSIDLIRPDWEAKLASARSKMARKAAAASAIHALNLLLSQDEAGASLANAAQASLAEERMIQEALRLSLLDEEERRAKESRKERKEGKETRHKASFSKNV